MKSQTKKHKSKSVTRKEVEFRTEADLKSEQKKKLRTTLDFSFKEIKKLEDIKTIVPREGEKWTMESKKKLEVPDKDEKDVKNKTELQPKEAPINQQQSFNNQTDEAEAVNAPQQPQQKNQQEQKKIPPPSMLVPVSNYAGLLITQQNIPINGGKTMGGKLQENKNKNQESKFRVELFCTSLILSQNKLASLNNFYPIMSSVMMNLEKVMWVDLSYNFLTSIDYNFRELPNLQSLYLNCNQIKELSELKQLSHLEHLRSLKIYGNAIEQIVNYRLYVIDALPQLKRLDSVLVSKKERDNSKMIVKVFEARPVMKNNQQEVSFSENLAPQKKAPKKK